MSEPPHPYCTEHDQPLDWCFHSYVDEDLWTSYTFITARADELGISWRDLPAGDRDQLRMAIHVLSGAVHARLTGGTHWWLGIQR